MQSRLAYPHKQPATLQDAKNHLQSSLASFERYPADSDHQRGYEAALRLLQEDLGWHLDECPICGSQRGELLH
jgi:hypothetical protein